MIEILQKYPSIKNYKISKVVCDRDFVEISFYDSQVTLYITPDGDCCSINWFECFDNHEILIDQYINIIDENPFYENSYDSSDDGCDDVCEESRIIFINDFTLKFRHTCNGYYSGWVN